MIAVVGAGTMGAGIAQVAAAAGHRVLLHDARPGGAAQACEHISTVLAKRVGEGKLKAADRDSMLSRLIAVEALPDLAPCGFVVEAIVEVLEAKRALFAELESLVTPEAILATNTSSLSITAIARDLKYRDRCIGLHFFNPVPAMKLVEIVSGLATAPWVVERAEQLARAWGKTTVRARSTPGFIVNRIARPYYAEALLLLEQCRATPAQIDLALRGAGFPMGPCELMDLIGHDINYSVTESVFTATFGDRRYQPSTVQRELVDGGLLGRKSGRGFYDYAAVAGGRPTDAEVGDSDLDGVHCTLRGDGQIADSIGKALAIAQMPVDRNPRGEDVRLDVMMRDKFRVCLMLTDGRSAAQVAADNLDPAFGIFDWTPGSAFTGPLAVSFARHCPSQARELACSILKHVGVKPISIGDAPGLIVARTIAMLVNEAADAVQQGVCDEDAVNTAMRLGTNYPAGPFEWLTLFGQSRFVRILNHLHACTRSERYRISPWLLERYWAEEI